MKDNKIIRLINIMDSDKPEEEYISYIAGGLFGDFFHQLSVIKEKYMQTGKKGILYIANIGCLLYTSPSPRDRQKSRMPSSA